MRFLLLVISFISLCAKVEAQIDPSSAMLLNSGSKTTVRDGGIDSGRYTVRPRSDVIRHEERTVTTRREVKVAPSSETTAKQINPESPPITTTSIPSANDESDDEPAPSAPVKVLPDARRFAMLELSFAPGYLYNESKSTFANRNYFLNAPVMNIDAKVWVSKTFGLHTGFLGTLNGNVSDSLNNTKNATASDQWFAVGAQSRHFFGEGGLSPMLQFRLDYREFQFRVPSDSVLRNKLGTSGLFLAFEAEIPTSGFGSWVFGADFGPKLQHRETSAATDFRTGDDVQTTSVGVHLGARYRFDGTQSVFWKASYGAERNLFSGSTSIPDPVTGAQQTNVSVTNTFTIFQLGYTWAN